MARGAGGDDTLAGYDARGLRSGTNRLALAFYLAVAGLLLNATNAFIRHINYDMPCYFVFVMATTAKSTNAQNFW